MLACSFSGNCVYVHVSMFRMVQSLSIAMYKYLCVRICVCVSAAQIHQFWAYFIITIHAIRIKNNEFCGFNCYIYINMLIDAYTSNIAVAVYNKHWHDGAISFNQNSCSLKITNKYINKCIHSVHIHILRMFCAFVYLSLALRKCAIFFGEEWC